MNKVTDIAKAIDIIKPGDTVFVGGFNICGGPMHLLYALAERNDINRLTIVSEDFGSSGLNFIQGPEILFKNGQLEKIIVSFLGNHKSIETAINEGKLKAEFVPQGTLAERIRAAGAGLGGFYTPTGVGTEVAYGKEVRIIDGKEYLFEKPLYGDVALVKAYMADTYGNAVFKYTSSNFNTVMSMGAKRVILQVEKIVEPGEIEPDKVNMPGVFVDYIVKTEGSMF